MSDCHASRASAGTNLSAGSWFSAQSCHPFSWSLLCHVSAWVPKVNLIRVLMKPVIPEQHRPQSQPNRRTRSSIAIEGERYVSAIRFCGSGAGALMSPTSPIVSVSLIRASQSVVPVCWNPKERQNLFAACSRHAWQIFLRSPAPECVASLSFTVRDVVLATQRKMILSGLPPRPH